LRGGSAGLGGAEILGAPAEQVALTTIRSQDDLEIQVPASEPDGLPQPYRI
jgi:hypothetical protein